MRSGFLVRYRTWSDGPDGDWRTRWKGGADDSRRPRRKGMETGRLGTIGPRHRRNSTTAKKSGSGRWRVKQRGGGGRGILYPSTACLRLGRHQTAMAWASPKWAAATDRARRDGGGGAITRGSGGTAIL